LSLTKENALSEYQQFKYTTKILEHRLDTFGHVNNARYLELYEEARWDFIHNSGYGLAEILTKKQGPVVLDVNCRFKRELTNRETITILTQTLKGKGKISSLKQEIIKADGTVASEATFTFGFMDFTQRKLIDPPDSWLKAIGVISP